VKIAVLGSGGREHALVVRLKEEGHEVRSIPGSAAMDSSETYLTVELSDHAAASRRWHCGCTARRRFGNLGTGEARGHA
jgi:phosphoribosylamine-glycine ligase